jgi:hypothetical protein
VAGTTTTTGGPSLAGAGGATGSVRGNMSRAEKNKKTVAAIIEVLESGSPNDAVAIKDRYSILRKTLAQRYSKYVTIH